MSGVNGAATLVSGTTYRYSFTGAFTAGEVTVDFVDGSVADNHPNLMVASSQGFTVTDGTPPTAALASPTNGQTVDYTDLNGNGHIDVTYSDVGGSGLDLSTITDDDPEFTLGGAAPAVWWWMGRPRWSAEQHIATPSPVALAAGPSA